MIWKWTNLNSNWIYWPVSLLKVRDLIKRVESWKITEKFGEILELQYFEHSQLGWFPWPAETVLILFLPGHPVIISTQTCSCQRNFHFPWNLLFIFLCFQTHSSTETDEILEEREIYSFLLGRRIYIHTSHKILSIFSGLWMGRNYWCQISQKCDIKLEWIIQCKVWSFT